MIDRVVVHSAGIPAHEAVDAKLKPQPLELLRHPTRCQRVLRNAVFWA